MEPSRRDTGPAPRRRGCVAHRVAEDLAAAVEAVESVTSEGDDGVRARLVQRALGLLLVDTSTADSVGRFGHRSDGVALRVALLAAASLRRAPDLEAARAALAGRVLGALGLPPALVTGARAALEGASDRALESFARTRLVTEGAVDVTGVGPEFLAQLAALYLDHLAHGLARGEAGHVRSALMLALQALDRQVWTAQLVPEVLGVVLALPRESSLRRAVLDCAFAALHVGAQDPRLSALVLHALARGAPRNGAHGDGAAERALARLVGGVEVEAVTAAHRRRAGRTVTWSVPCAVGDSHAVALVEEDSARAGAGGGTRLVLGVTLPMLGTLRVDLLHQDGRVVARVTAASPEAARLVETARDEIAAALPGLEVALAVLEGDAQVAPPSHSIDHLDLSA